MNGVGKSSVYGCSMFGLVLYGFDVWVWLLICSTRFDVWISHALRSKGKNCRQSFVCIIDYALVTWIIIVVQRETFSQRRIKTYGFRIGTTFSTTFGPFVLHFVPKFDRSRKSLFRLCFRPWLTRLCGYLDVSLAI